MRLNGALRPHQGARPEIGRSTGARKYRDKRCERRRWMRMQIKFNNNKNNSNHTSNNDVNVFDVYGKRSIGQQQKQQEILDDINNSNSSSSKTNKLYEIYCSKQSNNSGSNSNSMLATSATATFINKQQQREMNAATLVSGDDDHKNQLPASNMAAMQLDKSPAALLLPLLSCCAQLAKRMNLFAASSIKRVKQSLVPEISQTQQPKLCRSAAAAAAAAFGVPQGPVGTTMASGQLKARQRQRVAGDGLATISTFVLCLFSAIALLPYPVVGDDGDNFFAVNAFSAGPETTTPEFDYASRGQKKFGDKCDNTLECGFPGSICDPKKKSCQCTEDLPVTNHIDKCGKEAAVNESCFFNEQCEVKYFQTECRDGRCVCRFEMLPIWGKDGSVECKGRQDKRGPETYIDPAMIGVLVGMALMFVIICVVLRLFSQARWRENRTIFNTPNPRLMNVSLLRDSKLLHGQERRGSRMSVRAPSRQPSMVSLRPHSPNPSLGKTGSNSHSNGSNASATSVRSARSNSVAPGNVMNSHHERKGSSHHQQHHQSHQHHHQQQQQQQQQQEPLITNITPNPADDSVTVEIIVPEKK